MDPSWQVLSEDLGEEALAWVSATNEDLGRAPHEPAAAAAAAVPANGQDELLDGEPVLVEDD